MDSCKFYQDDNPDENRLTFPGNPDPHPEATAPTDRYGAALTRTTTNGEFLHGLACAALGTPDRMGYS